MNTQLALKYFYKILSIPLSVGLLSSCVSSIYIGAIDQPSVATYAATSQTYTIQEYPIYSDYDALHQLSRHKITSHIKGLKAKQRAIQRDAKMGKLSKKQARILKRETHRSLKTLEHIKRIEKKVEKSTRQSVRADVKAIRAKAKLDKIRRKAGIRTITIIQANPPLQYYLFK